MNISMYQTTAFSSKGMVGCRMILAIDPGTTKSAYVVYDPSGPTIIDKGIRDNNDLCLSLSESVLFKVDMVAIEMIQSYGMAVGQEVFDTCVWIGRFLQVVLNRDFHAKFVYRKDVKMHLCGTTKAKDANIRQALIDLLGKEATKGVAKDMWAALGVAVTVAQEPNP